MTQFLTLYWAQILSVWGAIISTVALTWNIVNSQRDRGKLAVVAYIGNVRDESGVEIDKDFLVVSVTNIGRRQIMVKGVGYIDKSKKKASVFKCRSLPKMLKEGEDCVEYYHYLSFISDFKCLYAYDSTGKEWKVGKGDIKQLKKNYQEIQKKEQQDGDS